MFKFDSRKTCRFVMAGVAASLFLLAGCAERANSHQALSVNHFVGTAGEPMILAAYQPWFGRPGHINVGYSSQDRVVIEKQIEKAKQLGIAGFVVNWYGPSHDFENRAYDLMQQVAAEKQFKLAILYDEDDSDPSNATGTVISDLQYAYEHYIGQHSTTRDAYLHYNDRPMIFIFPKGGHTDWDKVREAVDSWPQQPLLIYKDDNAKYAKDFDGFYAWVNPGKEGWQANGSNWGQQYLDNFYQTMISRHPDKIVVGAAWPGFNDTKASWSQNRKMSQRCGRTLDDTMRLFRRYYNEQRPLPFLMIETWNDYEEGTAIENGVEACK